MFLSTISLSPRPCSAEGCLSADQPKENELNWTIFHSSGTQPETNAAPNKPALTEADISSRRNMLRGALAASCSLLLPASLLGCSKKAENTVGTEPTAPSPQMDNPSSPVPMESAAPAAPAKVAQISVQYQPQPKDGKTCAECMHFVAESNTCKLVEGNISPTGWCTIWAKKA